MNMRLRATILALVTITVGLPSTARACADPKISNVSPAANGKVSNTGTTTVTGTVSHFVPNTTVQISFVITNTTTNKTATSTVTVTTDGTGTANFSKGCVTPSGQSGNAATISIQAISGGLTADYPDNTLTYD